MTAVLGTAVESLPEDPRPALLLADLHVPADGGAVFAALQHAVAAAERSGARLFLLGDLFDSYVARAQVGIGIWAAVARCFAAAAGRGLSIHVLHGNRDFLLGAEFAAAAGVRLAAGGLLVRLAGAPTLLLHGDELCVNDLPYQRAKRWLRHPVVRGLARRLPLRWALRVAERARQKSRQVIASGDQSRFLPTLGAMRAAFATGAAQVVFGHIHRHAQGEVEGGRYWVLPAFDRSGIGLLADQQGIRPVVISPAGLTPGPSAGPCPWGAEAGGEESPR